MKLSVLKLFDKMLSLVFFLLEKKTPLIAKPKRILVIKLSAMGDAVCLMPAVRLLHDSFDAVQIDWLTSQRSIPTLFSSIPFIRRVYILPTTPLVLLAFFIKNTFDFRKYELIIDFDQYYRVSELISFLGKNNAGFCTPLKGGKYSLSIPYNPIRNEKLIFSDLVNIIILQWQGRKIKYSPLLPELLNGFEPSDRLLAFADHCHKSNKPILVFYPGSSPNAIYRRWPISRYLELISKFLQSCQVIVAGGPDERLLKHDISQAGYNSVDHIGSWSLHEWLWLFRHVNGIFVGNDAGLLHLAESQGMPVIGIFGPNIYSKWGSINPASSAAEIELECRPCIKSYLGEVPHSCKRLDVKCLADISTEGVAMLITQKLSRLDTYRH